MAITPQFKPGQLVRYSQGLHDLVGLVKSTQFARRRGEPVFALVPWCGKYRQSEQYIPLTELRLVSAV